MYKGCTCGDDKGVCVDCMEAYIENADRKLKIIFNKVSPIFFLNIQQIATIRDTLTNHYENDSLQESMLMLLQTMKNNNKEIWDEVNFLEKS